MSTNSDLGNRYRIIFVDDVSYTTAYSVYERVNGGDNKVIFLTDDECDGKKYRNLYYRGLSISNINDLSYNTVCTDDGHQLFLSIEKKGDGINFGTIKDAYTIQASNISNVYKYNLTTGDETSVTEEDELYNILLTKDNKFTIETSLTFNKDDNALDSNISDEYCTKAWDWQYSEDGETWSFSSNIISKSFDSFYSEREDGKHIFDIKKAGTTYLRGKPHYDPTLSWDDAISLKVVVENVNDLVSSITITGIDTKPLIVGHNTGTIQYNIVPSGSTGLVWSSSNTDVATIDQNGIVTPVGPGTTTITLSSEVNGISDSYDITIYSKTESIEIFGDDKINTNNTSQYSYSILPTTAWQYDVEWSTTTPTILSIDNNGKVTGINDGTGIITAKSIDGASASKSINVVSLSSGIVITDDSGATISGNSISLKKGETKTLTITVQPNEQNVTFSGYDTDYVEATDITGTSITLTGKEAGSTLITVSTEDGNTTKTYTINVSYQDSTGITITDSSGNIIGDDITLVLGGESKVFKVSVSPENAEQKVTFNIDETIASKSNEGDLQVTLTAKQLSEGTSLIVTTADNKEHTYTVKVINSDVEEITLNPENYEIEWSLNNEHEYEFTAYIKPGTAAQKVDKWTYTGFIDTNNIRIDDTNLRIYFKQSSEPADSETMTAYITATSGGQSVTGTVTTKNCPIGINKNYSQVSVSGEPSITIGEASSEYKATIGTPLFTPKTYKWTFNGQELESTTSTCTIPAQETAGNQLVLSCTITDYYGQEITGSKYINVINAETLQLSLDEIGSNTLTLNSYIGTWDISMDAIDHTTLTTYLNTIFGS